MKRLPEPRKGSPVAVIQAFENAKLTLDHENSDSMNDSMDVINLYLVAVGELLQL